MMFLTCQIDCDKIPRMIIEKPFPDIVFDQMGQEDLKQVMLIENASFPEPWHISFFKRQLRFPKKSTFCYVARLNNEVVGYVVFYIVRDEAHIMNIAVTADYRQQGVGKYLLASALSVVRRHSGKKVYLEVAVKNSAARCLYRQFGFEVCDVRKRYYSDGEDAYVMWKGLQD